MRITLLAATAALALATPGAHAATAEDKAAATLLGGAKFAKARASLEADYDRIIQDIITLTEIEAPPFKEDARGAAYMAMLKAEGLTDVERDEVGNVMGLRKGTGGGPLIVVTAHLDTVFPGGTNVKVRREGNGLYAPGIGDDTSSLPVLLAFIRAMKHADYATRADILFMGNVGEEGPGDLRGSRYLFQKGKYKDRIKYFISFEPGEPGRITNAGTGSRRYKVTFNGPGGHSMGDFGIVSPAFAMANAMVAFGKIKAPVEPKTVYNVGILEGGTSVNSIPFATAMTIDMRSNGKPELDAEEKQFLALLQPAVDAENAARSVAKGKISYDAKLIGDRPVGTTAQDARIVKIAAAVARGAGVEPRYGAGSTDSNIPMSMGIEAVTLGSGFETFRAHSLEEGMKMNPPEDLKNMAVGLATVLALAEAR
ncbi:M20/M25/M40 family metallo-hydrolase [Novosphingobium sp. ST904]|uniref:M20/M25/M40 family metallo-hydrolase n=1 Tax=Novosphingobium sp. ST904 TaxID=1684385 RepID=UPI0006CD7F2A|nr:M20/M25/M40 family metallo-hydrolase [Novosphingobium sp. ST904]KPH66262.1 peptidase M20 [Novosphingobium sp. ST904]TCM38750.1 di/tripeptidase [Novosphingobium sp. ST904]